MVQLSQLLRTDLALLRRCGHDELLSRIRRQETLCLRTLRPDHHPLGRRYESAHVLNLQKCVVRCHHQSSGRRHDQLLANQVDRLQDRLSIRQQDLLVGRLSTGGRQDPGSRCVLASVRQYRQLGYSGTNLETLRVLRGGDLNQWLLLLLLLMMWLRTQQWRW